MVKYYDRDGYYIAGAIGPADLTDFDNDQAAIAAAELIAIDRIMGAVEIKYCRDKTVTIGNTQPPERISIGKILGTATIPTYFMTGIWDYLIMGACTTTEATPNNHAITWSTTYIPPSFALHAEREVTTNHRRDDSMGYAFYSDDIYCSQADPIARRVSVAQFGYSASGSDLAEPTKLSLSTHKPYSWFDLVNPSGATSFLYNTGAIGWVTTGIHIHKGWSKILWSDFDGSGYATDAKFVGPYDYYVELEGYTADTGTDIRTILDLDKDSYAGDLDYVADFYQSASKYHKSTFDKMYADPQSWTDSYIMTGGNWFEGNKFRLVPLDDTSSLVLEEKNALNNDYYENPA